MSTKKNELQNIVANELKKYREDPFFGEELLQLSSRLQSLHSTIVVVGQFSVGKSALLNALLGEELLSTRRIESTKILTRIRYCKPTAQPSITLCYLDRTEQNIPIEDLADLEKYTTFQGEEITNKLEFVDLYWPLPFLDEQLILIDTPGANSITANAFAVTEKALKNASAVIYLFNGQKGMDNTDFELLTSLIDKKKRIFLVATHVDDLLNEEWSLIEKNVQVKLNEHTNGLGNQTIYPVSSVKALKGKLTHNDDWIEESYIKDLENDLYTYMNEREYEQAELHSIEYDLLLVQENIKQAVEGQLVEVEAVLKEKQQRLNRLILLTRQEYQAVLVNGEKILRERFKNAEILFAEVDENIAEQKRQMKNESQNEFKIFQKKVREKLQQPTVDSQELEVLFNDFETTIAKMYAGLQETVIKLTSEFQESLFSSMKKQDEEFVKLLNEVKTNVSISWIDFKEEISIIRLKNINLNFETGFLELHQKKLNDIAQENELFESVNKDLLERSRQLKDEFAIEKQELLSRQKKERNRLGRMPEVEEYEVKKPKFLVFKEKKVFRNNIKQLNWKKEAEDLSKKHKNERERLIRNQDIIIEETENHKEEIEAYAAEIADREQEINIKFVESIIETLNNNSEQVMQIYKEIEQDIDTNWELHRSYTLQQCEQHIDKIEETFRDFVKEAEEKHILNLKVN